MKKKSAFLFSIGIIGAFIGYYACRTKCALAPENSPLRAGIDCEDITFISYPNEGMRSLKLVAPRALFSYRTGKLLAHNAHLTLTFNDQSTSSLDVQEAQIDTRARNATFAGEITGSFQGMKLAMNHAYVDMTSRRMTSNEPIELTHPSGTLRAGRLAIDHAKQEIALDGKVESTFCLQSPASN